MEERHCSEIKQSVPTSVLWVAAVVIIVGLIMVGTLTTYVVISSFEAENLGALFTAKPEPEPMTPAVSEAGQPVDGRSQKVALEPFDQDMLLSFGLTLMDGVVNKKQTDSTCCIEGRIRNDAQVEYSIVTIEFYALNAQQNQIASTFTSVRKLTPDAVWEFSAPMMVPYEQVTGYRISSVSVS